MENNLLSHEYFRQFKKKTLHDSEKEHKKVSAFIQIKTVRRQQRTEERLMKFIYH